jgi:hypothetical protein
VPAFFQSNKNEPVRMSRGEVEMVQYAAVTRESPSSATTKDTRAPDERVNPAAHVATLPPELKPGGPNSASAQDSDKIRTALSLVRHAEVAPIA